MTRVGWLADPIVTLGGAELTQAEFLAAAPEGVEVIPVHPGDRPGDVDVTCDRYVIHNCLSYGIEDLEMVEAAGVPVVKYWHDVGPHVKPEVRYWLDRNTTSICCSPLQADVMGYDDVAHIPPAIDLNRFASAAADADPERKGAVSVASWANPGKAPHQVAEWGAQNGGVDFFGGGVCAPQGSREVAQATLPLLLANYKTFVFLPTAIEPFGRVVVEAWAAGCEVVTNGNVGARYWIEENPEGLETAAADFWKAVLNA